MRAEREDQAAIAAAISQCFEGDRTRQRIEAAPPVFFGYRQALDSDFGALAPKLSRKCLFTVAIPRAFVQLALSKLDDVVAQELLLVAQGEVHQAISLSR